MSTREYKCPTCGHIQEVEVPLSEGTPHLHCPDDGALLRRYFGNIRDVAVNYGFRPTRYATTEDARIAEYQFTHL